MLKTRGYEGDPPTSVSNAVIHFNGHAKGVSQTPQYFGVLIVHCGRMGMGRTKTEERIWLSIAEAETEGICYATVISKDGPLKYYAAIQSIQ